MADRIRWGILATGGIARRFVGDLLADGHEVAAVASSSSVDNAEGFAAEFGIGRAHGSYEALATDPDVDVVYVATPHSRHAQDALLCLEGGKHVLVEKAFTLNRPEAERIAAAAAERGLVAQEAMWSRFLPHMRRLREIIADGVLGEVGTIIADHAQKLPDDPSHRLQDPDQGGGALLDLGIYPVSFAWDVLGAPSEVRALSAPTPTGVDARTAIVLGYPSGAQALLNCRLDAAGGNRATVIGSEARIELGPRFYAPTPFEVIAADGRVIETVSGEVEHVGMQFEARAVEEAIAGGRGSAPELTTAESVEIMGTLDDIRREIGLVYPMERSPGVPA